MRIFKHPISTLAASLIVFGWSMTWFVGGPIDGLPGIELRLLLDMGQLSGDEILSYAVRYYSWPVVAGIATGTAAYSTARILTRSALEKVRRLSSGAVRPVTVSLRDRERLPR